MCAHVHPNPHLHPTRDRRYLVEHETQSALPKIITTGFRAIHLIYFFTAGADEVKCWQIRKGAKAPQAAGACCPAPPAPP